MFFQNRELRVRMVKTDAPQDTAVAPAPKPYEDPETMNAIAKDFLRHTGMVVAGVLAVSFVLTVAEKLVEKALEAD